MRAWWNRAGELVLALAWCAAVLAVGAYWIITGDDYGAAAGMLVVCVPLFFS